MAYCILRLEKIKSGRDLAGALLHNTREKMPENATPELAKNNFTFGGDSLETLKRYHERLPEKIRSNATHAFELVMLASKEWQSKLAPADPADPDKIPDRIFDKKAWRDYLNACDKWALETFGGKANLLHIAHHWDEKNGEPHSHIIFMPLKDGKLNAKFWIGGHRDRMVELQNDFYEKVGKPAGLDRGISRETTDAKHTSQSEYQKTLLQREAAVAAAEEKIKSDKQLYDNAWKRASDISETAEKEQKALLNSLKMMREQLAKTDEGKKWLEWHDSLARPQKAVQPQQPKQPQQQEKIKTSR